jgi:predicted permease
VLFRKRSDEDFREEVQAHLQLEADRLVERGMDPQEAMAAARRCFGNVTGSQERFYESRHWMPLDIFARGVRYALRQMRSAPVSTATVVLSLALGIGVNTAIFSLADQSILRALPIEEPERLVSLDWNGLFVVTGMGSYGTGNLIPYLLYRELRNENGVFENMCARAPFDVHLAAGRRSEPATVAVVTGSYFATLGVRPALGRLLGEEDDVKPDAHPVVVLSYDYWRTRFAGDPAAIGQQVRINDYPMTVVGVAERGFRGTDWSVAPALWVPLMMKSEVTPDWNGLQERHTRFLHVFGRLKPGISREQAQARLQPWFKAYLQADTRREGWPQVSKAQMKEYMASTLDLLPGGQGQSFLRGLLRRPILILLAATTLILLLACLNVANVSLAGSLARRRTTALRAALGASRGRILMEQLIESALLAAVGCAAGVLLAPSVIRVLLSFLPRIGAGGVALSASLDYRVLWFAVAVTAAVTLLSGLAPALYGASVPPVTALKQHSSSVAGGLRLRKGLVVGQFALALILLICGGLFIRTLGTLRARGPGFPTANLLMFRLAPLSDGYAFEKTKPLFRRLLAELQALPEVEHAGIVRWEMFRTLRGWNNPVTVVASRRIATADNIEMNAVTPDFFSTLGTPLTRGRGFTEHDSTSGPGWALRSALVNEEFVKRYMHGQDPLGARLGIGNRPDVVAGIEIVGVLKNFHDYDLRAPAPQVYFPLWERTVEEGTFFLRSRNAPDAAARSIRAAVARIDPALTVFSMHSLDDQFDRMLVTERMLATLAGAFAAVATLLAMIGLYGVLAFSAARRTKEIGVRLTLGAPRWSAGGLIVREAAVLALVGTAIALPASWALGRFIESQLFGVRPMDAATIAGAVAILVLVGIVASALPARRAATVSPWETLRTE